MSSIFINRNNIKNRIYINNCIDNNFTISNIGNTTLINLVIHDLVYKNNIQIYKNTYKLDILKINSHHSISNIYSNFYTHGEYFSVIKINYNILVEDEVDEVDELDDNLIISKIFKILVESPIYITDVTSNLICKYNNNLTLDTRWKSENPYTLVVTSDSRYLYCTDSNRCAVNKYYIRDDNDVEVNHPTLIHIMNNNFNYPTGLALDKSDNLYVVDTFNYKIKKFNYNCELILEFTHKDFDIIYSILVVNTSIYISDIGKHVIHKFDNTSSNTSTYTSSYGKQGFKDGEFMKPYALAADKHSNIYVVDTNNCRIQKFDSNFNFIKKWGKYGKKHGEFILPHGIAINKLDQIFVTDTLNSRVQIFDLEGVFIKCFGDYEKFRMPYSITLI